MSFSLKEYIIIEEIGRGSFGMVFKAKQKSLDRLVAIKYLTPQGKLDQKEILRFKREAHTMASLSHENIVTIYDYAYQQGTYYIVMEFIDGTTVQEALDEGFSQEQALFLAEKTLRALRYAHTKAIIHRDIKPGNILLGKEGQVRIADFGLALLHESTAVRSTMSHTAGTIAYMAPEAMVSPREVDHRVDIFALGCVLYQLFERTHPFPGKTIGDISYKILHETPTPPKNIDASLSDAIMSCLEKDREKRISLAQLLDIIKDHRVQSDEYIEEEIIALVNKKPVIRSKSGIPKPAVPMGHKSPKLPLKPLLLMSLASAILVLVTGLLLLSRYRTDSARLPDIPVLDTSNTAHLPAQRSQPKDKTLAEKKGPAPLTNLPDRLSAGIGFAHIPPASTIRLNGKRIRGQSLDSNRVFPVRPGTYHVEIDYPDGHRQKLDLYIKKDSLITIIPAAEVPYHE